MVAALPWRSKKENRHVPPTDMFNVTNTFACSFEPPNIFPSRTTEIKKVYYFSLQSFISSKMISKNMDLS